MLIQRIYPLHLPQWHINQNKIDEQGIWKMLIFSNNTDSAISVFILSKVKSFIMLVLSVNLLHLNYF